MKKTLSILLIFISLSGASYAHDCTSPFVQSDEECENLKLWDPKNFTDPSTYQEGQDYRFIVHTFTAFISSSGKCANWGCKYLNDLSLIDKSPKISSSIISNEKPTHCGFPIGFILSVPINSIAAMSPINMGSGATQQYKKNGSTILEYSKLWKIQAPDYILKNGFPNQTNEIVIKGTTFDKNEQVGVKGIFVTCKELNHQIETTQMLSDIELTKKIDNCLNELGNRNILIAEKITSLRNKVPILLYQQK